MDKKRSYNKNLTAETRGKTAAVKETGSRQANIKYSEKSVLIGDRSKCSPLDKLTGVKCRR
ncbi:MAG: hypothetical protein A2044_04135 [Candidatus Firestonebacteria bacterium GWA2_43_8]|nr:MAG: hypothetical protein A2044_04135 [Candidatus Firestonebacteria bacterium GWA2_43_8]